MQVSFGNLEELETDRNPFCGHEIPVPSSYSGLTKLTISNYHGSSTSLLSSTIATNLVNLKTLIIERCDKMVQVIKDDDDEDEEEKTRLVLASTNNGGETAVVLFPKLEELRLVYLPKLESFCDWKSCDNVVLPSLRSTNIIMCPNMKKLSSGFLSAPNLISLSTSDLNNDLELGVNVSFERLKILLIYCSGLPTSNNDYPLSHYKFFISLVDSGLEELELRAHGSMSLFPSSLAKLMNIRSLRISGCNEMVNVIEEDEEDEEEDEVASGGRTTVLFPKLEELELNWLPKLVSFCESRKHVVELPSLRKVSVVYCHTMKYFSRGHLTAPNLESVKINDNDFEGDQRDLNGALKQHYLQLAEGKVSFNRLKMLWIGNVVYPSYHHKIFTSLVDGLEALCLHGHRSTSLFSSPIAGSIANLRSLKIFGCNEIAKVIEAEEEVVSSGTTTRLFPKLEELYLSGSSKLVSFYDSKCAIELPSLAKGIIFDSPSMRSFSLGHLDGKN